MSDEPIAGWYPDPRNSAAQWRWWDGRQWTDDTAPRGDAPPARPKDWGWDAPVERPAPGKGKPPKQPKAARTPRATREPKVAVERAASANTGAIWVLAFAPWLYLLTVGGVFLGATALLGSDPTMLPLLGAGAAVVGLIVLVIIAELDGRALRARELSAPSSLLVVILAGVLYFAVRARKVAADGARSRGPAITFVIVIVLTLLAGGAVALFFASLVAVFAPGSPAVG